jgi:hypothetical protein
MKLTQIKLPSDIPIWSPFVTCNDFKVLQNCNFKPFIAIFNEKNKNIIFIFKGEVTLVSYLK